MVNIIGNFVKFCIPSLIGFVIFGLGINYSITSFPEDFLRFAAMYSDYYAFQNWTVEGCKILGILLSFLLGSSTKLIMEFIFED